MRVNRFLLPVIVIVALLGTTLIAQAAGFWSTSGKDSVDLENMTAADIKGWMTLQQVIDGLKITQEELYAIGGIPPDVSPDKALKDLEGIAPDFEINALRDNLAAPAGPTAPLNPIEPAPLPPGQVLPADQIKGRMTLREVSEQCVVPLDQLLAALDLAPSTDPNVAIKDLISQGKLSEVTLVKDAAANLQH